MLSSWGVALLLACAAVPLVMDTHGKLFVRGTNLMTVEDRAITAGAMALAYWFILVGVWLGVRTLVRRRSVLTAFVMAAAVYCVGMLATARAADAVYLLLHQACYTAGLCESQPVFSHVMYALSATSMPAGTLAALLLALVVALAFSLGRRRRLA